MNINVILNNIKTTERYEKYVSYRLVNSINIDNPIYKNIINNINKNPNMKCYYNGLTRICDNIGVVDINNIRIIDFDDDMYTMTNKGIDRQIDNYIN